MARLEGRSIVGSYSRKLRPGDDRTLHKTILASSPEELLAMKEHKERASRRFQKLLRIHNLTLKAETKEELEEEKEEKQFENKSEMRLKKEEEESVLVEKSDHLVDVELEATMRELLYIDQKFKPLVALLEEFSPGEDTIRHSYKLKKFEQTILIICPDEVQIQLAFSSLMAAALVNAATAQKLAVVGSSPTWRQGSRMRAPLLNSMQATFAKLDVLKRGYPKLLINAANVMGDYFAGARLANGETVTFLAEPLSQYLGALLASDDPGAHRCFTTQLTQNGRKLLSLIPEQIGELSVTIRTRMLQLAAQKKIWLMLAADLSLNEFRTLPKALEEFYAAQINSENEKAEHK